MDLSSIGTQYSAQGIASLTGQEGVRGGPPIDKIIQDKDADGNGTLSIDEVEFSEEAFAKIDSNEDGQLNAEELEAGHEVIKEDLEAQGIRPPRPPEGMMPDTATGDGMMSQFLDLLNELSDDTSAQDDTYWNAYQDGIDMMA